jgi:ABC-type nitrate/sulfonate/bicarbonate transport system ATPase subunit
MVLLNDIRFSYKAKNKQVLSNISFHVKKGDTLAIVGASGCGKSTLLRIISGILTDTAATALQGTITVDGLSPDQYRQTGKLAFMFQEATLMPHMNVRQNIELPLKIKGISNESKISNLLQIVGLEESNNFYPYQLSGGMKTRVALARSFSTNPALLLLDEPFSSLDIAWKSKLYIELEKLLEETDATLIIVTHDVQEALLLADNVIVMNSVGSIIKQMRITTEYTIMQRVQNISAYMDSVYKNYMLPIQDAIMNGQNQTHEK